MTKKKLAAFQAKRNFKKASAPAGPRFVIPTCVTPRCWLYALSGLSAEVQRTAQFTWDRNRTVHVYEHAAR
jgi:hypothetical protein